MEQPDLGMRAGEEDKQHLFFVTSMETVLEELGEMSITEPEEAPTSDMLG